MGPVRPALELRVELAPHEPRVVRYLHHLHQTAVRRCTRYPQAHGLQLRPEHVAALIPVTVAFPYLPLAVGLSGLCSLRQHAGILAKPHGAALGGHTHLVRHQVDDRMCRHGAELCAVGIRPPGCVARKFDDRDLHPQADAQIGDTLLPRVLRRQDHPLNAPVTEAAGHQYAAAPAERFREVFRRQVL